MYDSAAGRWTTEDPIGFRAGDANLFRFVGNSPTNLTDPSGLFPHPDRKDPLEADGPKTEEERIIWRFLSRKDMPNLRKSDYRIFDPPTNDYDCHSYVTSEFGAYPTRHIFEEYADYVSALEEMGYKKLENNGTLLLDFTLKPGFMKVVYYTDNGKEDGTPLHSAEQDGDGWWTSKIGAGPLIEHRDPMSIAGGVYGKPAVVFIRPRPK
jgi:hypothetical protein